MEYLTVCVQQLGVVANRFFVENLVYIQSHTNARKAAKGGEEYSESGKWGVYLYGKIWRSGNSIRPDIGCKIRHWKGVRHR